jgi:CRP/FNR family cyclic AMP-dependent transcriptional regulator
MVEENGNFANDIMGVILLRLQLLEERMQSFVFKKAKIRIMDFIKKTGELRGIKIGIQEILINHGMSHKEIAYLTDTSRQTVARVLGELKKDDLIHFSARKPNKILIRNMMSLA